MKRFGIIGGMSFESTAHYYERINRQISELAGGFCSADLVVRSVNFQKYHDLMDKGDWETISLRLLLETSNLVDGYKCDYVAIATNTMHKVADELYAYPLVHIGDCVAEKCREVGAKRVALLGTRFTMEEDFMKKRLEANGLEVVDCLKEDDIRKIDQIIFEDLCHGRVMSDAKIYLQTLCNDLISGGYGLDGVILGCTELEMALDEPIRKRYLERDGFYLFDTTQAHIDKIVQLSLS